MLQQERDKRRQQRIVVENDILELVNRNLQLKRDQDDLRALSRNIVNKTAPTPEKLYMYVGGAFWKTPNKNYYKSVEKALGDSTVKRKQLRTDLDRLLIELMKATGQDEYSLLNAVVADQLSQYHQRIQDELELAAD